MNISNKKLIRRVVIVSALALAMLLGCLGIIFGNDIKADAFQGTTNIGSQSTNLGEMLRTGYTGTTNVFDNNKFWNLITQITGESNPSLDTLDGLGRAEKTSADLGRTMIIET